MPRSPFFLSCWLRCLPHPVLRQCRRVPLQRVLVLFFVHEVARLLRQAPNQTVAAVAAGSHGERSKGGDVSKDDYDLARYAIDSLFWFGIVWAIGKTIGLGWFGSNVKIK